MKFKLSLIAICLMLFSCVHDSKPSEPVPPVPPPTVQPNPLPPVPPPAPVPPEKFVVHFNFNSSKLGKDQKEEIKKVLENKAKDVPVHIVGYADSQGHAKYNLRLSNKRAVSVKNYLLKLDMKGPISYEGKGEGDLVNADKTVAEHKLNRRSEVVFVLAPMEAKKDVDKKEVKKVKKHKKVVKAEKKVELKAEKKAEKKAEVKKEPTVKDVNVEDVKMVPVPEPKK